MKRLYVLVRATAVTFGAIFAIGAQADDHYLGDEDGDALPWIVEVLLCNPGAMNAAVTAVGEATGALECSDPENVTVNDGPDPGPIPPEDTPDGLDSLMCGSEEGDGLEDPESETDGSCDYSGETPVYTPPDGSGGVPTHHELLCGAEEGDGLEDPASDADGSCDYSGEEPVYTPPSGPDGIPDPNETLCSVEDNSTEDDGSCDEDGQYIPPEGPGQTPTPNEVLCSIEDNSTEDDGSCDEDGQYSPPGGPGETPTPNEVLCSVEDNSTADDGSCDEDGNYVPPTPPGPPEDLPSPGDLKEQLDDLLRNVHCSGYSDPVTIVQAIFSDADCDGDGNHEEIAAGCDPTDPESNLASGCEGSQVPDVPPEPPEEIHCSGYTDPVMLVLAILSDADCDGRGNHEDDAPLDPGS